MSDCRRPVLATDSAAERAGSGASLASQLVRGTFCIALVVVLSLPQARTVGVQFGWVPFWLLALPGSAWLAIAVAQWQGTRSPRGQAALRSQRPGPPAVRRRPVGARRIARHARAA